METNVELQRAWDFVERTGVSIFLTGKAGTGKTTFLKAVRENSAKTMVVVAPTGVAALNAGGMTIHSFFQLPLSPFVPGTDIKDRFDMSREKRKIIRALDLLVIDEISMVRSDLLDAIDYTLRKYRHSRAPFGGVQLLMIGDLQQLTPVVTPEDELLLHGHYDTPYFFSSQALQRVPYVTIQLTKVYRQQDPVFIDLLGHVRTRQLTTDDLARLNSRWNPSFHPATDSDYIRLTTHNRMADDYNHDELARLQRRSFTYNAELSGNFPEYAYPTDESLTLKVGAQVMFVKNDSSPAHAYFNGRIGHVTYADPQSVQVLCPGDDKAIDVTPQTWENAKYTVNEKTHEIETDVQGTFTQLPLRLAWAVTIHKSQGLTFDHVIIDAGRSFAPGQVYVALSRCRSLEGIVLATKIEPRAIISDERVETYISRQEEEAERSVARLDDIKEAYFRQLLTNLFTFTDIGQAEERLSRLFIEHLQKAYPKLVAMHKQAMTDMQEKVIMVAWKWTEMLKKMPVAQLHSPELLTRVGRSCAYFMNTLAETFASLLEQSGTVETGNKQVRKRLADTYQDLKAAYEDKCRTLESIAEEGFTISNYLNAKQHAILAPAETDEKPSLARRRTRKEPQPKEKKEPTREVTLRMFRQGMSREAIARERNLAVSTVIGHLESYLNEGKLKIDDVVSRKMQNDIKRAMVRAKTTTDVKAVRELLPPEVTYADIRMVMHAVNRKA